MGQGKPFAEAVAIADGGRIRDAYFDAGYPRATVTTQILPGADATKRIVRHAIEPGLPVRIGKIALRGNFRTREWVLRDELAVREGELLTRGAVERMRANLNASGLFSSVNVNPIGLEDERQEIANLLVRVEERHDNRGEVKAGFGFNTVNGLYSTAEYRLANAFGIGASFQLRVLPSLERFIDTAGLQRDEAEARLTLPRWIGRRLFGVGVVLETSGLFRNENTERFGTLQTLALGQAVTYNFRGGFFDRWNLSFRYDFRRSNRSIDLIRPAGNTGDLEKADNIVNRSGSVGPELVIDRREDAEGRPNPLAPAQGYLLHGRAEYASEYLGGTDRFLKLGVAGQVFVPLTKRFQFSSSASYDHGIPLAGDVLLPEVERFFAGGDTTVRGFEQDRLATEIVEDPFEPGGGISHFRVLPVGGNIRFLHRFDLQGKVWAIGSLPVASALFLDTGLVTNSLHGFRVRDLRHALGVALARWVTPVGNLSLEWAVPLDPELGDNPLGRLHINFGASFGI
jgi:outer membrane protein insertion porin family